MIISMYQDYILLYFIKYGIQPAATQKECVLNNKGRREQWFAGYFLHGTQTRQVREALQEVY